MDALTFSERCLEDDYYYILGCNDSSSAEQILVEYKHRILICHPDKNQDADASTAQFQKLQEAKKVLCDPEKRKEYDRWKSSGLAVSYNQWVTMHKGSSTQVFHWATPKTKGNMLEFNSELVHTSNSKFKEPSQPNGALLYSHNSILEKFRNYEI